MKQNGDGEILSIRKGRGGYIENEDIRIHINIYPNIHGRIHTYTYIHASHIHTCARIHPHMHMHTYTVRAHTHMYAYTRIHIFNQYSFIA